MIRQLLLLLLLSLSVTVSSQVQNGYVRTKGTSTNRTGSPLPQVQVFINGLNGAKISASNGTFNFNLGGGKTQYSVKSVIKQGYNLLNPLASSYNTGTARLELVMLSREEELNEKARIKKKIEQNITAGYERQMASLNKQKEDLEAQIATEKKKDATASAKIQKDIDALNDKIDALDNQYLKRNDLIEKLVSEYVRIDYATLDEQKAQLSAYIENGELEKADVMLNSININKVMNDIKVLKAEIQKQNKEIASDDSLRQKILKTAKMYWRGRYDIAVQNMENDSAGVYVKQLADVDTTDLENVLECAYFYAYKGERIKAKLGFSGILYYLDPFSIAEEYYQRAVTILEEMYENDMGDVTERLANELINLAAVREEALHKDIATDDLLEAEELLLPSEDEEQNDDYLPLLAIIYRRLGDNYLKRDSIDVSKKMFQKALKIDRKLAEKDPDTYNYELGSTINNLANLYWEIDSTKDAENGYIEACKVFRQVADKNPEVYYTELMTALENLAKVRHVLKKYRLAEKDFLDVFNYKLTDAKKHPNYYIRELKLLIYEISMLYSDAQAQEKDLLEYDYQHLLDNIKQQISSGSNEFNETLAYILHEVGNDHWDYEPINLECALMDYKLELYINKTLAEKDSLYLHNYAMSMCNLASFYESTNNKNEALPLFEQANQILEEEKRKEQAQEVCQELLTEEEKVQRAKDTELGKAAKEAGEKYLAENAKKEGVRVTASGLQYKVIKKGTGKSPKATDEVKFHYEGFLTDGTIVDSSVQRGGPTTAPLNYFIAGLKEGLQLMKEGGKTRFFIPYNLAYGEARAAEDIPPYSAVIFDVELIEVQ